MGRILLLGLLLLIFSKAGYSQVTFTSSNLPIIVINTSGAVISDEPKIMADMGIIDNGPGNRNQVTDPFNNFKGKIGIERRGSSSQMFPKSQYGIELWTKTGADSSAALLGMPEEEDWILFAPYNDKSLMRDVLAYHMARKMGRYAPRTRYCELVLNGAYQGLYVLIEKVKRDNERVDVSRLDPNETSGDDVTGGYIIKIDKITGGGGSGFLSAYPPPNRSGAQNVYFQYEYPDPDQIVPAQAQYIKNYVDSFEKALSSPEFHDATVGYRKYADASSFVDYMIMNEVSKNVDAYRLSTFLHKKKDSDGGKLFLGPVWDFNLGFGNANYCTQGNPEGFVYDFNSLCPTDGWLIPFWWERLLKDVKYKSELGRRSKALREGPFQIQTLHSYIDSVANVQGDAQHRNFQRWPVLGQYVWPNSYVGQSFSSEVQWLKNWLSSRAVWLDVQWGNLYSPVVQKEQVLKVSPNPSSGKFLLEVPSDLRLASISVMDAIGRSVYVKPHNSDNEPFEIDLTTLPHGVYLITLQLANGETVIRRIVKTDKQI